MALKVYALRPEGRKNFVLRWQDPVTGKWRQQSAKTASELKAGKAAEKLERDLNSGNSPLSSRTTWEDFVDTYLVDGLADHSQAYRDSMKSALNHVARILDPGSPDVLTEKVMQGFISTLRREGMKPSTINTHLRHITVALNWAAKPKIGIISRAPKIEFVKCLANTNGKKMRSRPVKLHEVEAMVESVPAICKKDPEKWQRLLRGLYYSGLRLGEALQLSWDEDALINVQLDGPRSRLYIDGSSQKSGRDSTLPITPEFFELLDQTPDWERYGLVFEIEVSIKRAIRVISAVGEWAGIVTNNVAGEKKHATAHDLRRGFGTMMANLGMPQAKLQAIMRHSNVATTNQYYVDHDFDDLADSVWNRPGVTRSVTKDTCPSPTTDSAGS